MSTSFHSLESLVRFYADLQIEKIYVKELSPNDNSKNQVYFGPGFTALNLFPLGEITSDPIGKKPIFKADVSYLWVGDDLSLVAAPTAQAILYPQYPEVRFSGFLNGAQRKNIDSIRALMTSRSEGRILFLGVDEKSARVIGSVVSPDSPVATQFAVLAKGLKKASEIFFEILPSVFLGRTTDPRKKLLEELTRIHSLGWINSKRLDGKGNFLPCNAPQCGGYTLEAELGITPNGRSEPDFMGWEVKQYGGSVLTLMTPEPTDGYYVTKGVEQFIRTYGYPDRLGRADRLNFGGTHFHGDRHHLTGLTITLLGYDAAKKLITDQNGGIALLADDGNLAAFWGFSGILKHWNRKHNNAVYVPSKQRLSPEKQYSYSNRVLLCEGTDALKLLDAISLKQVYYDPGIKLEGASGPAPHVKRRSQFRVKRRSLSALYETVTEEILFV